MARSVRVTVRYNRAPQLVAALQNGTRDVISKIAGQIEERASITAPVDTGSLSESFYTSTTWGESNYTQRAQRAEQLNRDAHIVSEVNPEFVISPGGDAESAFTAVVGSAVEHAVYQEFGTSQHRAQPSLIPATLGAQNDFIDEMTALGTILR